MLAVIALGGALRGRFFGRPLKPIMSPRNTIGGPLRSIMSSISLQRTMEMVKEVEMAFGFGIMGGAGGLLGSISDSSEQAFLKDFKIFPPTIQEPRSFSIGVDIHGDRPGLDLLMKTLKNLGFPTNNVSNQFPKSVDSQNLGKCIINHGGAQFFYDFVLAVVR